MSNPALQQELNLAVKVNDPRRIQALADRRQPVNFDLPDDDGFTPLYMASCKGFVEVVKVLLKCGARVDQKGQDLETPLFIAVRNNKPEVVELLLSAGAQVNELNGRDGESALHVAAKTGNEALIERLLRANANINIRSAHMETPLFHAARMDQFDAVYLLLVNDAQRNVVNEDGKTAMYVAGEMERRDVARLLQTEKAQLREVKSALDYDRRHRPPTMVEINRRIEQQGVAAVAQEIEAPPAPPKLPVTAAPAARAAKQPPASSGGKKVPTSTGKAEPAPAPSAAPAAAPRPEMIPLDIPTEPERGDVDPITGKRLSRFKTISEVPPWVEPVPPPEAVRHVKAPVIAPTSLVIVNGETGQVTRVHRPEFLV